MRKTSEPLPDHYGSDDWEDADVSDDRKSLADLAVELAEAGAKYGDQRILHIKSGDYYRIIGVQFRESDMALELTYTPTGEFYGQVRFSRTVDEMDIGKRFIFG